VGGLTAAEAAEVGRRVKPSPCAAQAGVTPTPFVPSGSSDDAGADLYDAANARFWSGVAHRLLATRPPVVRRRRARGSRGLEPRRRPRKSSRVRDVRQSTRGATPAFTAATTWEAAEGGNQKLRVVEGNGNV